MVPGTRRANRSGYAEHDDFEGLPVRQWRQDWVNVAPPQPQEQVQQNDIWAIELIHGMPKDSALLAPHSQELLRAARSGRLYKRPAPAEEEEADTEALQAAEKAEKKDEENAVQGFSIKLWKQIPRNNEGPGLSHLAKRRKGTVTISSKTSEEKTAGLTVTRATVRKVDAAGNPYTEEVTLADGQQVVGEIISTRVEAAPAAAAEGFVAPAPPQRRRPPPPPKRKSKAGPGRGKKKINNPPPGEGLAAGVTPAANGVGAVKVEGLWKHGTSQEGTGTPNPDSGMADGNGDGDGDGDDDDDDDDDDGDDDGDGDDDDQDEGDQQGDDADDAKIQDEEMTDAIDEPNPPTPSKPVFHAMDGIATLPDVVPPNPLTLAPSLASLAARSPKNEGSPLKNVMLQAQSPAESHAPPVIPTNAAEAAPVPAAVPVELPALETVISKVIDTEPPRNESLVAEPPSMVAGDEGQVRAEMDITMSKAVPEELGKADKAPAEDSKGEASYKGPSPDNVNPFPDVPLRDEALLPPPPEQVGNISSPRAYDGPDRVSDVGDKSRDSQMIDSGKMPERPPLHAHDSVMTEDTIKPEDSASVRYQMTESGAPSEVGTASAEETKDSAVARVGPVAEASRESSPPKAASPMEETETEMTAPAEPVSGKMSDETRRNSPVAPTSVLGDNPQAPAIRASPQTLGQELVAEPKEPTPSEAVRDENSPALKRAVQDSRRVNTPEQMNPVTVVEPKPYENVEAEPVPEVQDLQEPASTTRDEKPKRGYREKQSQEPVEERKQESQDEHRTEPMKEAKPPALEPEPFPVAKPAPTHLPEEAPSTSDAFPVPEAAPAPAPPLISPPILPPIADIASESRLTDAAEERKEDPPAGA